MRLAALVAAFEGESGAIAGLRSLGGVSVLERQLRLLHDLGAERIVLIGEVRAPGLAHELATLRARGLVAEAVADLGDAADRLGSAARVLLLADGVLPDHALAARVAAASVPALATVPDGPGLERYERIDADARWAGLALADGRRVAETAAMVGEWDPVSTLLRRLVQEHGERVPADVPPLLAHDADALADAERALLAGAGAPPDGWAERWIEAPLARALLPPALARGIAPAPLGWAAAALALAGGVLAASGWRWAALLALVSSGPLAVLAGQIARVRVRPLRDARPQGAARRAGLALAALGFAAETARTSGQWGWALTGALLVAALGALGFVRRLLARRVAAADPGWSARAGVMPWAMLPFALAGQWPAGLAALTAYALASLVAAGARLDRFEP